MYSCGPWKSLWRIERTSFNVCPHTANAVTLLWCTYFPNRSDRTLLECGYLFEGYFVNEFVWPVLFEQTRSRADSPLFRAE
jgi:hypothetical protein